MVMGGSNYQVRYSVENMTSELKQCLGPFNIVLANAASYKTMLGRTDIKQESSAEQQKGTLEQKKRFLMSHIEA